MQALRGKEFKSFHVRHEASLIELFFDLFFVANLATFTAKHEITNSHTITAYMGLYVQQTFSPTLPPPFPKPRPGR